MAKHPLTQIDLPEMTGSAAPSRLLVGVDSVTNLSDLTFSGPKVHKLEALLFEIQAKVVPNWFGVAVPDGVRDFRRPHVFFHPTPAQAGFKDKEYQAKSGKWQGLYRYVYQMGFQLAASSRKQILVMPFLTEGAKDSLGVFASDWHDIVSEIMYQTQQHFGIKAERPKITDLVVSSFSAGIKYSDTFRKQGAGVPGYLREAYDFDGLFSTSYAHLSRALLAVKAYRVLSYDQQETKKPETLIKDGRRDRYHLSLARWKRWHSPKPANVFQVHGLIPAYMLYHALVRGGVG